MVDPISIGTALLTGIAGAGASSLLGGKGPKAPSIPDMAQAPQSPQGSRATPRSQTPTFVGAVARPQDQSNQGGATLLGQ